MSWCGCDVAIVMVSGGTYRDQRIHSNPTVQFILTETQRANL